MDINYKYKWQINESAWYIRFYLWLYEADQSDVNFCKLFWAYVFVVPALFLHGAISVLGPIFGPLIERMEDRSAVRRRARVDALIAEAQAPPAPKEKSGGVKFLERVGDAFTRLSLKVSEFKHTHQRVCKGVGQAAIVLACLVGLVAAGGVVYLAVIHFDVTLKILLWFAVVIAVAAFSVFVVWLLVERTNTGAKVGDGFRGFGHMLKQGFIAVKSNTCPEVIVVSDKDAETA